MVWLVEAARVRDARQHGFPADQKRQLVVIDQLRQLPVYDLSNDLPIFRNHLLT